jgi:hypothetical protein
VSLMTRVGRSAPPQPYRMYLHAPEKWGKTSWAAFAPKPLFLMTQGETGLIDLIDFGQVPETAHLPAASESPNGFQEWPAVLANVRAVVSDPHDFETLVVDTANGLERLLSTHVLETEFRGQATGRNSYGDYGKGDAACVGHWVRFLQLLDEVRGKRRMNIILLAHTQIKSVKNPEGDDYDQYRPEGINKLWPLTHKWASVIASGGYHITIKDDKATGGRDRVLRVRATAAYVAGNRYGLPETIPCGGDPAKAYSLFAQQLAAARARGPQPAPTKEQFAAVMAAKGYTWTRVLGMIDSSQGTNLAAEQTTFAQAPENLVLDFFAWLKNQPDKQPAAPATPPEGQA